MSPEGWFTRGQVQVSYLWFPVTAATETDLELMIDTNIKRAYYSHVIIVPQLINLYLEKPVREIRIPPDQFTNFGIWNIMNLLSLIVC